MAIEVELKARLDESESVKKRLSLLGTFLHSYEKHDSYWVLEAGGGFTARIRREKTIQDGVASEVILVTNKVKEIKDGIEINDEQEFSVSSAEAFEKFLQHTGMKLQLKKEKLGWAWHVPKTAENPVLAELSMVKGLGWFIELELMLEDRDNETIEACRKRLLSLLAELDIAPEKIEPRTYSKMLAELAEGGARGLKK